MHIPTILTLQKCWNPWKLQLFFSLLQIHSIHTKHVFQNAKNRCVHYKNTSIHTILQNSCPTLPRVCILQLHKHALLDCIWRKYYSIVKIRRFIFLIIISKSTKSGLGQGAWNYACGVSEQTRFKIKTFKMPLTYLIYNLQNEETCTQNM